MAESPAHRLGQIIGDIFEETMIKYLQPIADKYLLFLDYRHPRSARNGQKEVKWIDINGNTHKLDIVMEENGSEKTVGNPRVFIEMAWRRYTKHSKNKAQEISGAIRPLIAKYNTNSPFFGAIVAGVFTRNSIDQMESEGFEVVYIPIEIIEQSFSVVGIDIHWEENTAEDILQAKIDALDKLNTKAIERIKDELIRYTQNQLKKFCSKLCASLERKIEMIVVMSVFGEKTNFQNVNEACDFIAHYNYKRDNELEFYKFKVFIKYSNGDKLEAQYNDKQKAIIFLRSLTS